jgi:hypothetical protein
MANMKYYKSKNFLISIANIIAAASAGLSILVFGGSLRLLILAISAAAVSFFLSKSISKEDRAKQEGISLIAFSAGILIPIGIILLFLITFLAIAIWKTYS